MQGPHARPPPACARAVHAGRVPHRSFVAVSQLNAWSRCVRVCSGARHRIIVVRMCRAFEAKTREEGRRVLLFSPP